MIVLITGCMGSSSDTQNNQNNSSDKVNTSQILENDATEPDNSSSLANNSDNSVPLTILTKSNEDYNNKLSVSGTTTYGSGTNDFAQYSIKINITNSGAPFSYNNICAFFDNGNKEGNPDSTMTTQGYTTTYSDGKPQIATGSMKDNLAGITYSCSFLGSRSNNHNVAFMLITPDITQTLTPGQTAQVTIESWGTEKDLLTSSTTGQLALHIGFYMGEPTSENAVASFHTYLPAVEELQAGQTKTLVFTDFDTAQKTANPNFGL